MIFPASPLFLWWDYKSIQLMLKPIMEYAMNNTYLYGLGVDYNLPWAPHHLGHWPGTYTMNKFKDFELGGEIGGRELLNIREVKQL